MAVNGIENIDDVFDYIDGFEGSVDEQIFEAYQMAGEEFVLHARTTRTFGDRSGNLNQSIGYIIAKDGDIKLESGFEGGEGETQGKLLAKAVLAENRTGWVLIGVAGMEYGIYVENIHGLSVISQSVPHTERILTKILSSIGYEKRD